MPGLFLKYLQCLATLGMEVLLLDERQEIFPGERPRIEEALHIVALVVPQEIDLFVDAGYCPLEPTTLIDLTSGHPEVLRRGRGVIDFL